MPLQKEVGPSPLQKDYATNISAKLRCEQGLCRKTIQPRPLQKESATNAPWLAGNAKRSDLHQKPVCAGIETGTQFLYLDAIVRLLAIYSQWSSKFKSVL